MAKVWSLAFLFLSVTSLLPDWELSGEEAVLFPWTSPHNAGTVSPHMDSANKDGWDKREEI
jgi:hypothetical protein